MRGLFEAIFDPLTAALGAIPFAAARWFTVAFLLVPVLAVFFIKTDYVFLGASKRRWWLDLRLWTVVVMIPYILIYLLV